MDALGGDAGPGVAFTPRGAAEGLVGLFGGVSQAAREMGVPRSTFRRWLAGSTPKGPNAGQLEEFARDEWRTAQADNDRWTHGIGELRVVGTFDYAAGGSMKGAERRDIPLGQYMDAGALDRLVDAYRDGADAEELGEIAADAINDPAGFYRSTFDPDNPRGHWDIERITGI